MNYITLEQLRKAGSWGDLPLDEFGVPAIEAAEEAIEAYCSRVFYRSGTVTRYYTPEDALSTRIDDLVSAATVATDEDGDGTYETTWASTEYLLAPYNAQADGEPYRYIEASAAVARSFPALRRSLAITGVWGWPAVPDRVVEATIIQASRFLKRTRSSPFGIETVMLDGTPVRLKDRLDPDVCVMLDGLRKVVVA